MPTADKLRSIEKYRRAAAGCDASTGPTWPIRMRCIEPHAMPRHCVHDIGRTPAALVNPISQGRPCNVHAHELHQPWSLLASRLERFEWAATPWGMAYLGSGAVKEHTC